MATPETITPSSIEQAIRAAVKAEIGKIIEEEAAKAQEEAERRIRNIADRLALNILSEYLVYENGARVVIEVKKK